MTQKIHVGRPNIGDRKQFLQRLEKILDDRWLTNNGPEVLLLEKKLETYLGVKHCVAMCNGTVALEIAIRAMGLTGEVIVPSYTFIATAHALHWQGLTPVFADIDATTHNISPSSVRKLITPKTSGIIGVHLWGRAADVDSLEQIATEFDIKLMFDAAHAFGCSRRQRMIGSFGECEVFSFHATKFFNTFEGGALVTNDDALAEKARLMRNFGFSGFDNVIYPGTNGKMIEICAAMGLTNLDYLPEIVACNEQQYHEYRRELNQLSGISVLEYDLNETNNFQYIVLLVDRECPVSRDMIVEHLNKEGILARKYFWPGCHEMQPYKALNPNAYLLLPNTIDVAARVVVLPTGTALPTGTVRRIAESLSMLINTETTNQ